MLASPLMNRVCDRCKSEISDGDRTAHNQDDFEVYICERDDSHYVILGYYTSIYGLISKIVQAQMAQTIEERKDLKRRIPEIDIPKLLNACACGGRYSLEWSDICRNCLTPQVCTSIEGAVEKECMQDSVWTADARNQIEEFAEQWGIDLG